MYSEGTKKMSVVKSHIIVDKKKIPKDPQNSSRIPELDLKKSMVLVRHH
jgi:hypothetical protein